MFVSSGGQRYRVKKFYDDDRKLITLYGSLTLEDFTKYFVKIHCVVGKGKMMNINDLYTIKTTYPIKLSYNFREYLDIQKLFEYISDMFEYDEDEELIYGVEIRNNYVCPYDRLYNGSIMDIRLERLSVTEEQKLAMDIYFLDCCVYRRSFSQCIEISLMYQHYKKTLSDREKLICNPYVFRYYYANNQILDMQGARSEDDIYAEYCPEIGG